LVDRGRIPEKMGHPRESAKHKKTSQVLAALKDSGALLESGNLSWGGRLRIPVVWRKKNKDSGNVGRGQDQSPQNLGLRPLSTAKLRIRN